MCNKIHWKEQTSTSSQENMKAKSDRLGEGHLAISDTKTYKAPQKNGTVKWRDKTDQENSIENPEISSLHVEMKRQHLKSVGKQTLTLR